MELITITTGVITLLVIGLTQIIKPFIAERFITLIPLLLAVGATILTSGFTKGAVITGLVIGLSSQGLYNQKNIVQ